MDRQRDLFARTLQDLYHIEQELEDLQSELAESATDEDLEEYYMAHSERTTEQIGRLEPIFDAVEIEVEPGVADDAALSGLRTEREELVQDTRDPVVGDLVDAELGRAIERLEITKLETLLELADRMELPNEIVDPLERTRAEAENGLEELEELTATA
ncbi:YciE/YciF ferroxidase family protein [Halopiger thermotolerans]